MSSSGLACRELLVIPICCVAFAIGGAVEEMFEEIIALIPVLVLLVRHYMRALIEAGRFHDDEALRQCGARFLWLARRFPAGAVTMPVGIWIRLGLPETLP